MYSNDDCGVVVVRFTHDVPSDSTRPVVHNVRDARADWKGEVTTCTTRKSLAAVGLKSRWCNLAEDMHTDACAAEHRVLPFNMLAQTGQISPSGIPCPVNGCCNSLPRPDECKNRGNYGELIRLAVARSVINVAGARNHLWRQATHPSRASPPSCRQRTTLQGTHPAAAAMMYIPPPLPLRAGRQYHLCLHVDLSAASRRMTRTISHYSPSRQPGVTEND
ncbi:hypothetical protein Bbelb_264680 [Branchiostoma belcheri]|nr:hypothetical protein Bbelb_264680 [Branchiostoma belcheri]